MKRVFDAKCLRCDSLNVIDIAERFGEYTDGSAIDKLLGKENEVYCYCPNCDKWTLHKKVTQIYESSSDNNNL